MVLLSKLKENTNKNTVNYSWAKPLKTSCCLSGKLKTIEVWHFHCIPGLVLALMPNTTFRTTFQPTLLLDLGSEGLISTIFAFFFFPSEFKFFWQSSLDLPKNDPDRVQTRGFQAFLLEKVFSKEKEDEATAEGAGFVLKKQLSRKQLCSLISFPAFQISTSKPGTNSP